MAYNVVPSDYRDHRALARIAGNLWENNGWMVWDRVRGEDVLLWVSPYRLLGGESGGPYAVTDIALSQTLLIRSRAQSDARRQMLDNPFLAVGYDLGDHLPPEGLRVQIGTDVALWSVGERRFSAAPPKWSIRGEHAGVEVDLEMEAVAPAFWFTDPASTVESTEERWFTVCASARGSITHKGERLAIDGYASHERHVHCGARFNPVRALSARGVTWHSGAAGSLHLIFLSRPTLGAAWCRVVDGDAVHNFSAPQHAFRIEETDYWVDPQSRLHVPCAWRSTFSGPSGELQVEARAFSRGYYLWPHYAHGCTVLYWWIAEAEIELRLARGSRKRLERVQYIVHDNRLLYRQHRDD